MGIRGFFDGHHGNVHPILERTYRNYLYLDSDRVIDASYTYEGGSVDKELRSVTDRKFEKRVEMHRTIQVQIDRFLRGLVGEGVVGLETFRSPPVENSLVCFDAVLRPPVPLVVAPSDGGFPVWVRSMWQRLLRKDPLADRRCRSSPWPRRGRAVPNRSWCWTWTRDRWRWRTSRICAGARESSVRWSESRMAASTS